MLTKRASRPANVRRLLVGYEASGQIRLSSGWLTVYAWGLTVRGALRELENRKAQAVQEDSL